MDYKKISLGLGVFSIALGLTELFAAKRVTEMLGTEGHEGLVKGFGARELVAGAGLLMNPAHSTGVWNRVAGDAMDLTALGVATRTSEKQGAVWGSIALVMAITALDVIVARGLDATTGRMLPDPTING